MMTMREEYTTEKQNSVARLLWAKGPNMKDIHKELFPAHGGKCLPCKVVKNWVEKFSEGCLKVIDHAQHGHHVQSVTEATVQRMEKLI
jgi:hypothetical protein